MNYNLGKRVTITSAGGVHTGVIMPNSNNTTIFLKLNSGYTIGIARKTIKASKSHPQKIQPKKMNSPLKHVNGLQTVLIINTGGTIASKVDYTTGGVIPQVSAEELVGLYPELRSIANIKTLTVGNFLSENMTPADYTKIAEAVKKNYNKVQGIIITHGTDTLHYTSAALSFMLESLPIPVILVGSQRSSDRGSTDAFMNLICALEFINKTYFKGVAVCMHESINDDFCVILPATKVRKMHTSRRDAFQPINAKPIAKINYLTRTVTMVQKINPGIGKPVFRVRMDPKVAILRVYPGITPRAIKSFSSFKGVVVEGSGLGNLPILEKNKANLTAFKSLSKKGIFLIVTSQTIYGRVNFNVYASGRIQQEIGMIDAGDMTTETAFVKLSWLLGNFKKTEVKDLFQKNLRGELNERSLPDEFLPQF